MCAPYAKQPTKYRGTDTCMGADTQVRPYKTYKM